MVNATKSESNRPTTSEARPRDRRLRPPAGRLPLVCCILGLLAVAAALVAHALADTAEPPLVIGTVGLLFLVFGVSRDPSLLMSILRSRTLKYGSLALYQSVLVFGILVCVNIYTDRHPFTHDMTETGFFTLADQTKKVFAGLQDEVRAYAFFQSGDERSGAKGRMRDLLGFCEREAKGKFRFEFIDPDGNPSLASKYKVVRPRTTVFVRGANETKINDIDEEAIVNAIIKITRTTKKRVYLLSGHGESDPTSGDPNGLKQAVDDMEANQYDVQELHLYREKKVPDDAAVIILAGPQKPLFENELDMLSAWLRKGGSFVALVDPYVESHLETMLEEWGVTLNNDTVVDVNPMARMMGGGDVIMPLVNTYGRHEITAGFRLVTSFPLCRSVVPNQKMAGATVTPLLYTTKQSWSEKTRDKIQFTPGVDDRGPVCLGVAVLKATTGTSAETRMVVVGDSDFASNRYYDNMGNGNLFQNCVNWVAHDKDLISIKAKTLANTPLRLTQRDAAVMFYTCLLIVPLFFLSAGAVVWYVRRSL